MYYPTVHVLRLAHRPVRDKRITTHVCLVARAFGAEKVIFSGSKDPGLIARIDRIVKVWGGRFMVEHTSSYKEVIKDYKKNGWLIIHLTMYGDDFLEGIRRVLSKAAESGRVLVIVGGEKVPPEVYNLADINLSVTHQPHSEVAALSVFLDHFFQHRAFKEERKRGKT